MTGPTGAGLPAAEPATPINNADPAMTNAKSVKILKKFFIGNLQFL
jgi:hypothetical protein